MMNKNKKAYGGHGDSSPFCSFHPREAVVGVCAQCLKDRLLLLLLLADDHSFHPPSASRGGRKTRTGSISLPKVFALGSSFLQRLDSRHHRPDDSDGDDTSVASLDADSFISIKFEDNGKATWDSHKQVQPPAPVRSSSSSTVVVAEHVKRGGVTRWRKQVVGRLLQLARWKRSAASHVGLDSKRAAAAERSKSKARPGRGSGWIRSLTLTRRRAAAAHGDRAL